jgi:release factor glutamine methyltransferase
MPTERGRSETWRILDVLDWTRQFFASRDIESARLDAEVLLAHVLGLKRIMLYARFDQPLTVEERDRYRELVRRRAHHEPVAYLVGEREFWSLSLEVRPGVLIPRPDSELLVQAALTELPDDQSARVADVGTGSGALALAIAHERPRVEVVATDVSDAALEVAGRNAERLGLSDRVRVLRSDLLAGLVPDVAPFDLVVANLPYVPSAEVATLMPDVRDHEPVAALDGGPDGLALVRRLIADAPARLTPGGALILEAGSPEIPRVAAELRAAGYVDVATHDDLGGRPRVAFGRRAGRPGETTGAPSST